ncbi:efflux RND transporter periplasmic adaptor subunit [Actinomyces bowdenii]|uniref:Transporter n=1 Tax=Actinomyces capricornis TaxID=2755559 RepID=A0ABM7UCS1_9ACTO|nr:efflux RND transporter periplasmic adaptor subunit [Actinomyces capricornis]MCR2053737.1 efflux RND transporter periplasmic adaptor subunit [Actinomyces bowdenii]BDA64975.1 transporter [Actinomyces capricornis]
MKRYIVPTLKALIAVVIAVALTKIAFFPSKDASSEQTLQPGFTVAAPTVTVAKGDISNAVSVEGQIVEDAPVEAKSTLAGSVARLIYEDGATVSAGEPIMTLKKVETQEPTTSVDEEGNQRTTQPEPKTTWVDVYAPASGTVKYKVIRDQETPVGTVVATVAPGTYSAKGTVTASQQYRLTSPPSEASVSVDSGPAPFSCTDLKVGTRNTDTTTSANPAAGGGEPAATPEDGNKVEVRCSVPSDQQVFPGLKATINIDAGSATDALLVPVSAVEGNYSTGVVWLLSDPADPASATKTEVSLGINDGSSIQVTEGLSEGDTILQFVPGKDVKRKGEPNSCEPDGSVCYDEKGEEITS